MDEKKTTNTNLFSFASTTAECVCVMCAYTSYKNNIILFLAFLLSAAVHLQKAELFLSLGTFRSEFSVKINGKVCERERKVQSKRATEYVRKIVSWFNAVK